MHLHELFYYQLPDGRTERTMYKMAPSNLRRANVPENLIKQYENLRGEQTILHTHNEKGMNAKEIDEINPKVAKAHNAITEFLRNQEKEHFPDGNFFQKNK